MTNPLSFSEKFLQKFGNVVFPELSKREKIYNFHYKLHSNDFYTTDIKKWLKSQLNSQKALDLLKSMNKEAYFNLDNLSEDEKALKILKFVKDYLTYKPDINVWKMPEYWQTVDETIDKQTGDCEDGAILIVILCVLSGVNPTRVKLQWGDVVGGGHCYVVYRRQYDASEIILDWCYWYSSILIQFRKWIGEEKNYLTIWGNARIDKNG